ncbi:MAG: GGDEF domain-containing protein [Proteobacteria bacterium]|nr:GGDEF domain-containing protein [Pseudomonadota bacterium]
MNHAHYTLNEQLRITDREINRRLELLHFTKKNAAELLQVKPIIAESVDSIVDRFYANQISVDEIAHLIGDAETLSRLKNHMRRYILDLFDGNYGQDYVQSRLRIGLVHKRIGVTPKLYISSIRTLLHLLSETLRNHSDNHCPTCSQRMDSLEKIILFDLELVFDTYIHSLMDALEQGKRDLETYAESLEHIVAERTRELSLLARKDGLTNLYNQRSFHEELRREISRSQRSKEPLSLLYMDLDNFKVVNDTKGHLKGDEILVHTAQIILQVVREEDVAARYGGDEFAVILPHTSQENAVTVARRLIENAESGSDLSGVTFSIGVATREPGMIMDREALVSYADKAMYQAKKQKGHAVHIAKILE